MNAPGRIAAFTLLALAAAAALFAYGVRSGRIMLPDRWNPWTPLDVRQPPGPLTGWKLWRATHDPQLCRAALDLSGMTYHPVPDQSAGPGCELHGAVRVERLDTRFGSSFLASCPLALGVALFDAQYLQPAAQAFYGEPVARIDHVGSYACRNVNHAASGSLSQHAHANALDITGFVLAGGRRITVTGDWNDGGKAGQFLRQVHDGACKSFNATLGPEYNALHATHFHVDMGPYRMCR
ncbi:extensin family protein [Pigmentiphaga soli]|uniref:Extensin family protein n=1 Tax=Pigmentiphaga soli TaxID=1007095 RepID=A0ABP8H4J1_9BURK